MSRSKAGCRIAESRSGNARRTLRIRHNFPWISRICRERLVKTRDFLAKLENTRLIFAHHWWVLDLSIITDNNLTTNESYCCLQLKLSLYSAFSLPG